MSRPLSAEQKMTVSYGSTHLKHGKVAPGPPPTDDVPRLTSWNLFLLACWECLRDGCIDDADNLLLKRLKTDLGLDDSEAVHLFRMARKSPGAVSYSEDTCFDPVRLYDEARTMASQSGSPQPKERFLLAVLAGVLGFSDGELMLCL